MEAKTEAESKQLEVRRPSILWNRPNNEVYQRKPDAYRRCPKMKPRMVLHLTDPDQLERAHLNPPLHPIAPAEIA